MLRRRNSSIRRLVSASLSLFLTHLLATVMLSTICWLTAPCGKNINIIGWSARNWIGALYFPSWTSTCTSPGYWFLDFPGSNVWSLLCFYLMSFFFWFTTFLRGFLLLGQNNTLFHLENEIAYVTNLWQECVTIKYQCM